MSDYTGSTQELPITMKAIYQRSKAPKVRARQSSSSIGITDVGRGVTKEGLTNTYISVTFTLCSAVYVGLAQDHPNYIYL